MIQVRCRVCVRLGRTRRNEEVKRVVVEQHGQWHEVDFAARTPIGGTQDGDGFARVAMSAVHEGEIVMKCRLLQRVEVGSMTVK